MTVNREHWGHGVTRGVGTCIPLWEILGRGEFIDTLIDSVLTPHTYPTGKWDFVNSEIFWIWQRLS